LQLLAQKGVVPMRLQELLPVALQPQEQHPFFTAGFPFRSGLKKKSYLTQINQVFISKEFAIIHFKKNLPKSAKSA
jgi:hypothetical protein